MSKKIKEQKSHGIVYSNPASNSECVPLIVPKAGPDLRLFTVNLRLLKHYSLPHEFPMPNIDAKFTKTSDSRFFDVFDFIHSYWQLALHPDSQECQSLLTHKNTRNASSVLSGFRNAVLYLQSFYETNVLNCLMVHFLLRWTASFFMTAMKRSS